jgi:hypothetical protein
MRHAGKDRTNPLREWNCYRDGIFADDNPPLGAVTVGLSRGEMPHVGLKPNESGGIETSSSVRQEPTYSDAMYIRPIQCVPEIIGIP